MKKVLTIVIALTLIAGLFVIPSFAEDPTRVFTYETEGGVNVGLWTGNTDGRKARKDKKLATLRKETGKDFR